ncbi:HAMP domain-containing histidine kinase [Vibrio sp. ZSDE26]|uniref:histidine kinase n=1 Tax=Vibrio amylolyticus TaxID=2847292 RepID=A0A9X2BI88_9VIBR|nr:HAMP domain-containing sensor histidine kinase [Vibrio amylolyticus]MCK6264664.1 HAMP domain-containing histidine kinase [Vibrio amylolyticus]
MSRLITYSDDASDELAADSENATQFYHQLFQLHEISIELSKAESLDDLYRLAVTACLHHLDIDRMGILMIDKKRDWMVGTWGTDDEGRVRSEADFATPMLEEVKEVVREMSYKGKVCVWHDKELYEFSREKGELDTVGYGWNAALAIWDDQEVIGWMACDNLINHKPFQTYQSHTLRLFGSTLGEFIKRQKAEEAVKELNRHLESRILSRTLELSKAQKELENANLILEQKVLDRTAQLNERTRNLESVLEDLQETQAQLIEAEKQNSLTKLVLGMAHELNTPLGNINVANSLQPDIFHNLKSDLDSGSISKTSLSESIALGLQSSDIITTNVTRMSQLVAQFKRLSIHETQNAQLENIELNQWLEDTVHLALHHYKKEHSITFDIHVIPNDSVVKLNTWQLSQIIEDLILNSLEHGLTQSPSDNILVIANVMDQELEISVEDNGRGIEPDILKHIFDPFVTTARGKGSKGLGLSLVYNLVTQGMKGNISYYQPLTGGSGFAITLPLSSS